MANCPLEAQEDESLWRKGKLNVKMSSPVPSSENKKVSEWSPYLSIKKDFRWTVRGRTWRSSLQEHHQSYLMHHYQNASIQGRQIQCSIKDKLHISFKDMKMVEQSSTVPSRVNKGYWSIFYQSCLQIISGHNNYLI